MTKIFEVVVGMKGFNIPTTYEVDSQDAVDMDSGMLLIETIHKVRVVINYSAWISFAIREKPSE